MDYETEEQQLEAIKKWWKENSSMIVGGIAIGVSAIFGWQYYQAQTITHTEQASVYYEQVLVQSEDASKLNEQLIKVNKLEAEFSDTPYAALSALLIAKQQLAAGDLAKAQQQYEWVINNASQDEFKYLAKIRLSRLMLATNKAEQAITLLSESYPESYMSMVLELKGDALLTLGKKDQAKVSYQQALSLATDSNRWLQLKIDDIGDSEPAKDNKTGISEPSA